jgi:lipid-A-disaccharide synthase
VPEKKKFTVFLSAAEASGDAHAANLMRAIRAIEPGVRFVGVAGERMAGEGCEALADLTKKAAMLLGGPLLRLGYYWRMIRRLRKAIRDLRPDLCIPVDSPAFNWHIAAAAKRAGTPVLYYIAPQVWAWAPWRVKKLARLTDRVACILPFEEAYLRQRGVAAHFVGHPIFDSEASPASAADRGEVATRDLTEAWAEGAWRVALLPGSRPAEVAHHAEGLLASADAIIRRWPRARCTFALHNEESAERIRRACRSRHNERLDVLAGPRASLDALARSHFAVAGSGTVTIQAARLGVPMVVFYRTGALSRLLYHTLGRSRRLMPARRLCLVNILAGDSVAPELMPWNGDVSGLVARVLGVMGDLGALHQMRRDVLRAVAPLTAPAGATAADNTARLAMELMKR